MTLLLETDRLFLKLTEYSDLEHLIALRSDPEVMKYIGDGLTQSREQVENFLNSTVKYQDKNGFGFCSVFEKRSGEFIGQAGLFHLGFNEDQAEIEIAYRLHKKYRGNGFAIELVKALIQWGFSHLSIKRLVAVVHPENMRSLKVLEKAGMTYTGKIIVNGNEMPCYETYKNDGVEIVSYNSQWPKMAADEIKKIRDLFSINSIIDIQHVGSTAIPGLSAKPIIDLQIAVESLTKIKRIAIENLKKLNYEYWHTNPDPERMFFVKGMPPFGEKRTHHVHIVEPTSKHWHEKILFRDYLIAHPEAIKEYEKLKQRLAMQYRYDREKYTTSKTDFIREILRRAKT